MVEPSLAVALAGILSDSDPIAPIAGTTLGVRDGNNESLILPVEEDNEIWKSLEQNSARPMQIGGVSKRSSGRIGEAGQQLIREPSRHIHTATKIPISCLSSFQARAFMNPQTLQ